jgi:hypothetical protein
MLALLNPQLASVAGTTSLSSATEAVMLKLGLVGLSILTLCACAHEDLRVRHGSPLHTYRCGDGKSFQARQIISGEVEVTAGGKTRDVTDAGGDAVPNGPRMTQVEEATHLTGMPGGPYEACLLADEEQ